jgi:hypothetical protein
MSLTAAELSALKAFVTGMNEVTRTTGISLNPATGALTYDATTIATLTRNADLVTYELTNTADS